MKKTVVKIEGEKVEIEIDRGTEDGGSVVDTTSFSVPIVRTLILAPQFGGPQILPISNPGNSVPNYNIKTNDVVYVNYFTVLPGQDTLTFSEAEDPTQQGTTVLQNITTGSPAPFSSIQAPPFDNYSNFRAADATFIVTAVNPGTATVTLHSVNYMSDVFQFTVS